MYPRAHTASDWINARRKRRALDASAMIPLEYIQPNINQAQDDQDSVSTKNSIGPEQMTDDDSRKSCCAELQPTIVFLFSEAI